MKVKIVEDFSRISSGIYMYIHTHTHISGIYLVYICIYTHTHISGIYMVYIWYIYVYTHIHTYKHICVYLSYVSEPFNDLVWHAHMNTWPYISFLPHLLPVCLQYKKNFGVLYSRFLAWRHDRDPIG